MKFSVKFTTSFRSSQFDWQIRNEIAKFVSSKRKSTETITERCFSCQSKSVCQKLARSCKQWKSAKIRYTLFLHEVLLRARPQSLWGQASKASRPGYVRRRQECPLDFSLKSNMAKTAPNLACQFVYTCRKLPCTYFPPFLLRISEIKYAKTLVCHGWPLLQQLCYTIKENRLLFSNTVTISVVFLLIFFPNDHLNP